MMLDARAFEGQIEALAHRVRVTVPGLGPGATIGAMAEGLLAGAPARFALAGLSMGGIVAMEMWRRAPQRITHLALLDTTPYPDTAQRGAVRLEQIARVDAGDLHAVVESMTPLYLGRHHQTDQGLRRSILKQGLKLGPETFRRQSLALRDRCDCVATLPTIDCPSLVLCGREDELCPVGYHTMMATAMPRADLVVLAECGHLSTMEEPAAVADALARLLDRPA
jgi:pimeloyl-ACP methyl ester carboxylesterase